MFALIHLVDMSYEAAPVKMVEERWMENGTTSNEWTEKWQQRLNLDLFALLLPSTILDPKLLPQELWHGFSASWDSSILWRKVPSNFYFLSLEEWEISSGFPILHSRNGSKFGIRENLSKWTTIDNGGQKLTEDTWQIFTNIKMNVLKLTDEVEI